MKENVLDVLMFLFDNYVSSGPALIQAEEALSSELKEAGFESQEIQQAFLWLEGLLSQEASHLSFDKRSNQSFRVFTSEECEKLDIEARGMLYKLQALGVLNTLDQELIIDRAMTFDSPQLELHDFKQVVGLVLLHKAKSEPPVLAWAESLLYDTTVSEEAVIVH